MSEAGEERHFESLLRDIVLEPLMDKYGLDRATRKLGSLVSAFRGAQQSARREMCEALRKYEHRTGPTSFEMLGDHGNRIIDAFAKENGLE